MGEGAAQPTDIYPKGTLTTCGAGAAGLFHLLYIVVSYRLIKPSQVRNLIKPIEWRLCEIKSTYNLDVMQRFEIGVFIMSSFSTCPLSKMVFVTCGIVTPVLVNLWV